MKESTLIKDIINISGRDVPEMDLENIKNMNEMTMHPRISLENPETIIIFKKNYDKKDENGIEYGEMKPVFAIQDLIYLRTTIQRELSSMIFKEYVLTSYEIDSKAKDLITNFNKKNLEISQLVEEGLIAFKHVNTKEFIGKYMENGFNELYNQIHQEQNEEKTLKLNEKETQTYIEIEYKDRMSAIKNHLASLFSPYYPRASTKYNDKLIKTDKDEVWEEVTSDIQVIRMDDYNLSKYLGLMKQPRLRYFEIEKCTQKIMDKVEELCSVFLDDVKDAMVIDIILGATGQMSFDYYIREEEIWIDTKEAKNKEKVYHFNHYRNYSNAFSTDLMITNHDRENLQAILKTYEEEYFNPNVDWILNHKKDKMEAFDIVEATLGEDNLTPEIKSELGRMKEATEKRLALVKEELDKINSREQDSWYEEIINSASEKELQEKPNEKDDYGRTIKIEKGGKEMKPINVEEMKSLKEELEELDIELREKEEKEDKYKGIVRDENGNIIKDENGSPIREDEIDKYWGIKKDDNGNTIKDDNGNTIRENKVNILRDNEEDPTEDEDSSKYEDEISRKEKYEGLLRDKDGEIVKDENGSPIRKPQDFMTAEDIDEMLEMDQEKK